VPCIPVSVNFDEKPPSNGEKLRLTPAPESQARETYIVTNNQNFRKTTAKVLQMHRF
jgi:hypothetical protein